jgi:hypothetical protein
VVKLEISEQNPAARARRSLEDLLVALAAAIPVFVARLQEPCPTEPSAQRPAAPGTPRAASPPNRDYF